MPLAVAVRGRAGDGGGLELFAVAVSGGCPETDAACRPEPDGETARVQGADELGVLTKPAALPSAPAGLSPGAQDPGTRATAPERAPLLPLPDPSSATVPEASLKS